MPNDFSSFMNKVGATINLVVREEFRMVRKLAKDFDNVAAKKGQSFPVPLPVAIAAVDVVPGATPPAQTNTTVPSVQVTIDNWKMAPFSLSAKEASEIDAGKMFIPQQLKEAVRSIIKAVNADVMSEYKKVWGFAGTAGTSPFATNINPAADVEKVLNDQMCPQGDRHLVIDNQARADGLKLSQFNEALKRGDNAALKKGEMGELFGMSIANDSQVPYHATGAAASYLVNNGAGYAIGVKTLTIDTGTGGWVEGDIISFAGHSQTYAVDAGSSTTVLNLKNALVAAVADNEAITKRASHRVNLAFDPQAFALVARPLQMDKIDGAPELGTSIVITDEETGLSMKLTYLPGFESATWYVSLAWGVDLIDGRRIARLAG